MKNKIFSIIQIISGLMLLIFGLNIFLQFIPMGQPSAQMGEYMKALFSTGFLFPLIGILEIVAGLAFIINKFAALMAIVIMPVILNALLAHMFLDPAGIGGALFIMITLIIIMIRHNEKYKCLFKI
jgi:putative oxidoreductase